MIQAYPLTWPQGKQRRPAASRKRARFGKKDRNNSSFTSTRRLTVDEATNRVLAELDLFTKPHGSTRIPRKSIVVSTNIPTRKDNGLPLSGRPEPHDPGVAVYFTLDKKAYCTECDAWDRVADNLAAVAAHLNCLRGIERYEVGESHDVFRGHAALPWSGPIPRQWWEVLGVPEDTGDWGEIVQAYNIRRKICHPDVGGSHAQFIELQEAYELARKHLQEVEV